MPLICSFCVWRPEQFIQKNPDNPLYLSIKEAVEQFDPTLFSVNGRSVTTFSPSTSVLGETS